MISVLGKMFLWQREGPGGRWTCQTSRRGETRDCRCDLGGDGNLRSRVLRWPEENYFGLDIGNQAETGTARLGPDRPSGNSLRGLGRKKKSWACQRRRVKLSLAGGKNQEQEGSKPAKGPRWWWRGAGDGGGRMIEVCFPRGMGRLRNQRGFRIYQSLGVIPRVLMAKYIPWRKVVSGCHRVASEQKGWGG